MVFRRAVTLTLTFILTFALFSCSTEPYPYQIDEYITLPSTWVGITVNESEIQNRRDLEIMKVRLNAAISEPVTGRTSVLGDIMNISFSCYLAETYETDKSEGNDIKYISDPDCTIKIGDNKYPSQLENSLTGKKEGDEFSVKVTLPDTFSVNGLAGSAVIYDVKVNSVTQQRLPLLNDAFVKTVSHLDTVEEYEEYMYLKAKENLIWEKLLQSVTVITYPVNEVNAYTVKFLTYYNDLAEKAGVTVEEYVAKKFFISMQELHLDADQYAKSIVKNELLLYYFVRVYDLQISDSEYQVISEKYVKQYGLSSLSELEGKYGSSYVRQTAQLEKILEYASSVITVIDDTQLIPE